MNDEKHLAVHGANALYTAEGSRALDRAAIENAGIPGAVLMARAGRAAWRELRAAWPSSEPVTVLCGGGNNGGDGYVIARLAHTARRSVQVLWLSDPEWLRGDARAAWAAAVADGVPVAPFDELPDSGVLVDAMLGTGLGGSVREPYAAAIEAVNRSGLPVLAVDVPSGLCADTGGELGVAVHADRTVTFIGLKQGLLTGRGPALAGTLVFEPLELPETFRERVDISADCLEIERLVRLLPARPRDAHKGRYGHAMVIGGEKGMAGAVLMASEAAARTGAGLTSCATRPEHVAAVVSRRPEVMAHAVVSGQELAPLLDRASVLVIGPGLGRGPFGEQLLQTAAGAGLPMVVDADALNILAAGRVLAGQRRDDWILTPHPGEAARLLDCPVATVQEDRFAAARALQARYGGVVVLKGVGTLVYDGRRMSVCPYGNPGMASGGMGDVLSGILGGLVAQRLRLPDAARLGVCLHAASADAAAVDGARGLLATDLLGPLRRWLNFSD